MSATVEAHLSVVFATLSISGEGQKRSGLSNRKILTALRALASAAITIGGRQLTAPP